MFTYLLQVEYDGTDFCGWQKQPHRRSVQGEIEKAARALCHAPCKVTGAGRTDKGVHAVAQSASIVVPARISPQRFVYAFNAVLPSDISISSARAVPASFNPRYDAKEKVYRYVIWNDPCRSVWSGKYAWHVAAPLDISRIKKAASFLIGTHDFSAFNASGSTQADMTVNLRRINIVRSSGRITLTFRGDRFLYKMIRNIVGTLVDAGTGTLSPEMIPEILKSRDRRKAGRTAPARGLFLMKVIY